MGETEYVHEFVQGEERRRLRLFTSRGKLIELLVQYETFLDGQWLAVFRYDNYHGFIHKDILDAKGNVIKKVPLGEVGYRTAVEMAIEDIEANWREHKKEFLKSSRRRSK